MHLQPVEPRNPPYDYASAFRTVAEGHAEALLPLMSPVFFRERARLLELVGHTPSAGHLRPGELVEREG